MASNLPDLTVVTQVDHAALTAEIAQAAGIENLSASDPAYRVALAVAYRESLVRQDANEQARGVMLAYANGSDLDHIGETYYRNASGEPVRRLPGETDADYRARLQQSVEGLSVAGPDEAYKFHALSYSATIKDVNVASPAPVSVVLTLLHAAGDGSVNAQTCQAVHAHLEPYRPLTDALTVQSAEILHFTLNATLTLASNVDRGLVLEAANKSISAYLLSRHRLGGRVVESGVHAALTVEGVEEVRLNGWEDIVCQPFQAPYCTAKTIV
tara:strand:- start:479 stop:1288 length:810 start_codon:yes stop_codon:yes gene_type:complete